MIGHHILGHLENKKEIVESLENFLLYPDDPVEEEANNFASEKLMPKEEVKKLLYGEGITKIKDIADFFAVSEMMAQYRMQELGYVTYKKYE